ncbi:MAG TPA: hypothetical protein VKA79_15270 [Aestuariivirgaceae bacterium]|nr:hypothetical protein [Aestuariivirgaceae bacterium]
MSIQTAKAFLDEWVAKNVPENAYPDKKTAVQLAARCVEEASEKGLTKAELEQAAGEDLVACMMDAQMAGAESKLDDLFE